MIRHIECVDIGFIIMELAFSDLKQSIQQTDITIPDLEKTVLNVIDCLIELAKKSVYHGDLHCGNVFLVYRNYGVTTVIGDFGESEITDSPTASSSDLFQFISSLREYTNFPRLISLHSVMGRLSGQCERDFDINQDSIKCNVDFLLRVKKYWTV
jgi:hypothetical protein